MDNCMEQTVILTGYDLIDLKSVLSLHIGSIKQEHLRVGWVELLERLDKYYNSPKFVADQTISQKDVEIKKLEEEIEKADSLIQFYAYRCFVKRIIGCKDWCREDDIEQIEDDNGFDWNTGGKRAREYHDKKYPKNKVGV